jgi:bisphosphoglycerate-dependent phosphoglycerate mutase
MTIIEILTSISLSISHIIPQDEITGLEIPNGLPLIYDIKSKCVKLLDDGTG